MKTDVAIVGGGPGGAASAMFLIQEGIKPVIIEKETFPRYHIGESMTGECGGVVRQLGLGDEMLKRRHPIKHGVKVYGQHSWFVPVMARDASYNLMDQTTWQVRRSDFDRMMLEEAVARGATLIHGQATRPLLDDEGAVRGVQVKMADGGLVDIESEVLLDCSGQKTFLAQAGVTGPKYLGHYDKQIAIFSQIANGIRDDGETRDTQPDNTLIFYQKKYHWAWWIPLDDEVVSVGVVSPAAYFLEQKESKAEFLKRELYELHSELKRRIPELELIEETRSIPNYSFQVKRFCGKGFICIGDAHRFIDPIFSFGLYVTMKEAQYAAPRVRAYLEGANRDADNPFAEHQVLCEKGIDVLEDTLDGFWEHPFTFAYLVHARHRELMVDVFAGRIYENQPSEAVEGFRRLLKRERTYDSEDIYSLPIGSRYHPERAPLWEERPPI
ncbi:MAG: tryptophan 7-halogenase [Chloroflexi bacterium]|nr:tryptophan 7-halogenase [Chloroflexota bacterium]MCI0645776.1 tryptophan 7-halogenase [Chloroflexota bacterium]MCI0727703.1 tryptophan 7-halogenase [Chloroflexota bacterium]